MPYSFQNLEEFKQKLSRLNDVLYFDDQEICKLHPNDQHLVDEIKNVKPSTIFIIYVHTLAHSLMKYDEPKAQDFGETLLTLANELIRARKQALNIVKRHMSLLE